MKMHPVLFSDSAIAKNTAYGRMNEIRMSEALVTDVLAVAGTKVGWTDC